MCQAQTAIQPDSLSQASSQFEIPIRQFDKEAMEAYKEQSVFDYSNDLAAGPSWFGVLLFWLMSKLIELLGENNADWLIDNFFNVLIVFGIILGIVLIIRLRFGAVIVGSSENRGSSTVVTALEQEQDYEKLFQEAMGAGDLKLASRYLYIKTLQALHLQGVIKLKKWKTMLEYIEEIPVEKRPFFHTIGILFESTWYGNYEPSEKDFEEGISSSNQLVS